jgi:hypothetical protein
MLAPALAKRIAAGQDFRSSMIIWVIQCKTEPLCVSPETEQLTGSSPDTARCAGDEDVLVEEAVGGEDGAHDVGIRS